MPNNNDDWSWIIAPLLGVAGLLGAYIFSSTNNNNGNGNNNGLPPPPPPPPNNKKAGCGCTK